MYIVINNGVKEDVYICIRPLLSCHHIITVITHWKLAVLSSVLPVNSQYGTQTYATDMPRTNMDISLTTIVTYT